jgi:hypothetical protein
MTDKIVDLHMRRVAKALTETFAVDGDEEHDDAVYDAQDAGRVASDDYSDVLGAVFAGYQVALGALRYAFESGGASEVRGVLVELQAAVEAWLTEATGDSLGVSDPENV